VPGFSLFRVPARWLFLYAFAAAMLAGVGLQTVQVALSSFRETLGRIHWVSWALLTLLAAAGIAELLVAAQHLPLNQPTAPESFSSLRTAPAHILAAQAQEAAPGRFLSMSDTLFDPGDLGEIDQIYQSQLASQAHYAYVVNVKRQEILAPNLPLAWRIYAVDGYDGGVLPLARYARLQHLLLDESDILADGRLREGLVSVPSSRLLSIFGAEYIITDKVHDVWIDGVFYDLAFETILAADLDQATRFRGAVQSISSPAPPHRAATTLGIVSHLQGAQAVAYGTPVAHVHLTMRNKGTQERATFVLRAGHDTAQGLYSQAAHEQARVGRRWQADPGTLAQTGYDYVTELSWDTPRDIVQVEIEALPFGGSLSIRGLALIDRRDRSSVPLLLTSKGHFVQLHSGDVKIYQARDALPRAYVVHQARIVVDDTEAVAAMADPAFDPSQTVLLHQDRQLEDSRSAPAMPRSPAESRVTITSYRPHEITLQAELEQPGYVVISDTWYPGWQAWLDGQLAPIERANLAFRAIHVPQGTHSLRLIYRPASYLWGLRTSLGALGIITLSFVLSIRQALRRTRGHARAHPN
jgi:hypothetical protein